MKTPEQDEAAEILTELAHKLMKLVDLLAPDFTGYEERRRLVAALDGLSRDELEGLVMMAALSLARIKQSPLTMFFGPQA